MEARMDPKDEGRKSSPGQASATTGESEQRSDEEATQTNPSKAYPREIPRSTASPDLLFVTYTKPSEIESRNIKAIRSHVMRHHLRRRRTEDSEVEGGEQNSSDLKRQRIDLMLPGGVRMDPFGTLSITMTRAMSRLFDHYATTLSPLHYPPTRSPTSNPMTTRWIPIAIKDPALLHSTICSARGHLALLEGKNGPELPSIPEYMMHKTETIQLINGRMADLSQALADETLAAIALLVTDQMVEGNYSEMTVHMQGLAKLVSMRGGLDSLGMNGILAAEIQWCDIATSFMTSNPPILQLASAIGPEEGENFSSTQLQQYLNNAADEQLLPTHPTAILLDLSVREILGDALLGAFNDMNSLTSLLRLKPHLCERDMLLYDCKRARIQHRLASLAAPPPPPPLPRTTTAATRTQVEHSAQDTETSQALHLREACRLGAVLYSNMTLWGFRPPMYFYGDLATSLRKALLQSDFESLSYSSSGNSKSGAGASGGEALADLLIWVLAVGAYAATTRPERPWFVERLKGLVRGRGLKSSEGFGGGVVGGLVGLEGLERVMDEVWRGG